MLFALFRVMREEMAAMPGDMMKAVALMLDADPVWLAQNATAEELMRSLPVLNRVNQFDRIYAAAKGIGALREG